MEEHLFTTQGQAYRIRIAPAAEFATEIEAILAFLIPRAHVEEKYLRNHVPRALVLAVADFEGAIVSVCALKDVNHVHSESVRNSSGYPLPLDLPELGYAATNEHHFGRQLGRHLNEQIILRIKGEAFATVRVGNVAEVRNIRRCHFCPRGQTWDRVDNGGKPYQIALWVRRANAPPNCDGSPEGVT